MHDNNIAIRVENLGKQYRIGEIQAPYRTIRDAIVDGVKSPFRRASSLLRGQAYGAANLREEIWALRNVSFEVREGEVLGIIGRNGAGKTTLLKILSRIAEPTEGKAEIHGRVGSLLEVGTGMHLELTGRENIYLNGAILGMKREETKSRFDEIVEFSGIEKFIDTPLKHYSSGMQVRLAFSVAAHLEPEILLIDEVLAVGDAEFQKKCLGKMGDVVKEGRTVFFVSHNLGAVLNLCSRGILLDNGQMIVAGPIKEVVDTYVLKSLDLEGYVVFPETRPYVSDELRFISARILNGDGIAASSVELKDGLAVEIEYELLRAVRSAQVAFELFNSMGICVMCSTDFDEDPEKSKEIKQPGRYTSLCNIPPVFLRAGRYWIDVASSVPGVRILDKFQQAIAFEIVDSGSGVEKRLAQGRRGVVAPVITWDTSIAKE